MNIMDVPVYVRLIAVLAMAVALLCLILPFLNAPGDLYGLDGTAGVLDHWDIWKSKDPVTAIVYLFGDIVCHQQQSRSFILNGSQTALCMRDLSIITGAVLGYIIIRLYSHVDICSRRILTISGLFVLSAFSEWAIEGYMHVDSPEMRIITGILAGIGLISLLIAYYLNQSKKLMDV